MSWSQRRYLVQRSTWNVMPPIVCKIEDEAVLTPDEWKRVISDEPPGTLHSQYLDFLEKHGPYGHRYDIHGKKQPSNLSWLDE